MNTVVLVLVCTLSSTFAVPGVHGDLHEKIKETTKALEARPEDAGLHVERGELYRLHRDFEKALADFDRALRLDPKRRVVRYFRGRTLFDAGRIEPAWAAVSTFLETDPRHAGALALAARLERARGRSLEAGRLYDRLFDVPVRRTPDLYLERARAWAAAGTDHVDHAIAGLDEGIERLGAVITLELGAIEIEEAAGRIDASLKRLERIIARSPRTESWHVRKAEMLVRAGRGRDALLSYAAARRALEQLPDRIRRLPATRRLSAKIAAGVARLGAKETAR